MGGYAMRSKPYDGIHDDLKCTALAVDTGGEIAVFCSLDLLMIFSDMTDPVRKRIESELGIKYDNITIACIHTHAAPELRAARLPEGADAAYQAEYRAFLEQEIFETVKDCVEGNFSEVTAYFAKTEIVGFYGNRNGKDKPEDKGAAIIKFTASDGTVKGAAINLACHPTVLGADNLKISGDLLGYISRAAKEKYGVYPVMMQGASGDMSNRHYREGHGFEELERTGKGVCAQLFAVDNWEKLNLSAPTAENYHRHDEYDIDIEYWLKLKEESEAKLAQQTEYDSKKLYLSCLAAIDLKLKNPHIVFDFHASILRMGDLVICRVPCELFSRFGKRIKAACPAKLPLIWGYANGYAGYLSDEGEYGRTYESMISNLKKGGTEQITDDLSARIARLTAE